MPDRSRRAVLRIAGSVVFACLAGCSAQTSSSQTVPVDSNGERVTDYTVKQVRTADPTVLYWTGDDPPGDDDPGRTQHVTSSAELADLSFASEVSAADTLETFVRATDLETQSVYLHAQFLKACYDLVLQGVSRDESSVSVDLCRELKPADAECAVDTETTVGLAIRLPFSDDDFHGLGMSYGRQCNRQTHPVDFHPSTPTDPVTDSRGDKE